MQITKMITQFNIETNDDEYTQPEYVFDDKARQIEQIEDASEQEFGE